MSTKILWLDNEVKWIQPYVDALKQEGYEPNPVPTVSEAEQELKKHHYDLLILDAMIPTISAKEVEIYNTKATLSGIKTGIVFYQRMKHNLEEKGTKVLVITASIFDKLRLEFVHLGLPEEQFSTKYELKDVSSLVDKVKNCLQS